MQKIGTKRYPGLFLHGIAEGRTPITPIGKTLGEWTTANFNFNTYYNQSKVVYEAGAAGLNKILRRSTLFFQNSVGNHITTIVVQVFCIFNRYWYW
jgi:hypothetical protein